MESVIQSFVHVRGSGHLNLKTWMAFTFLDLLQGGCCCYSPSHSENRYPSAHPHGLKGMENDPLTPAAAGEEVLLLGWTPGQLKINS